MSRFTAFNLFMRQALLFPLASPFLPTVDKVLKDFSYAAGKLIGTLPVYSYPADKNLTDNDDGTITDNVTGLMWAKDGNGAGCNSNNKLDHDDALTWAAALDFAGHTDWRLPTIKEFQSIMDYTIEAPALFDIFINTSSDRYRTGSVVVGDTDQAWDVNMWWGYISPDAKTTTHHVRAVRDI